MFDGVHIDDDDDNDDDVKSDHDDDVDDFDPARVGNDVENL